MPSLQHSLHCLICSQLPMPLKGLSANPVVYNLLRILLQFRRHFSLHSGMIFSPIAHSHQFLPACTDAAFQLWLEKGFMTINDLYVDGFWFSVATYSAFSRFNILFITFFSHVPPSLCWTTFLCALLGAWSGNVHFWLPVGSRFKQGVFISYLWQTLASAI